MAYGITSTGGVTLASGAIAQEVRTTQTVGESLVVGEDGEYAKADPLNNLKKVININGIGNAGMDGVVSGVIAVPSTMTVTKSEQNEVHNGRATFTLNASAEIAFTDITEGNDASGSGDPDEDTLHVVSCNLALTESVRRSTEASEILALATTGVPGLRALNRLKTPFSIKGKNTFPASVVLGSNGTALYGMTSGKTLVTKLDAMQKMDDFPSWDTDGCQYPVAA